MEVLWVVWYQSSLSLSLYYYCWRDMRRRAAAFVSWNEVFAWHGQEREREKQGKGHSTRCDVEIVSRNDILRLKLWSFWKWHLMYLFIFIVLRYECGWDHLRTKRWRSWQTFFSFHFYNFLKCIYSQIMVIVMHVRNATRKAWWCDMLLSVSEQTWWGSPPVVMDGGLDDMCLQTNARRVWIPWQRLCCCSESICGCCCSYHYILFRLE